MFAEKNSDEEKKKTTGAVLVAISIPIFTSQLEKSREAVVDEANLRSAYAECSASVLTGVKTDNSVTVTNENGVVTATKDVTLKQAKDGWEGTAPEIAGVTMSSFSAGATITVTVTDEGKVPTFEPKN